MASQMFATSFRLRKEQRCLLSQVSSDLLPMKSLTEQKSSTSSPDSCDAIPRGQILSRNQTKMLWASMATSVPVSLQGEHLAPPVALNSEWTRAKPDKVQGKEIIYTLY